MFDINVRSRPLCNVLLRNIFLPFSPPAHKTKILFVAVCTIPTSLLLNDEWWINRACITDSMKFPIELFSACSLFSSFAMSKDFHWRFTGSLVVFPTRILTFWISMMERIDLESKTDIKNFQQGIAKLEILDKYTPSICVG